jgi:hypothetical protein
MPSKDRMPVEGVVLFVKSALARLFYSVSFEKLVTSL